jgi:hypothetical protein
MSRQPIKSHQSLADLTNSLGRRLNSMANRTNRLQRRIAKARELIADCEAQLRRLNGRDDELNLAAAAAIYAYLLDHPELQRGQDWDLGTGTASIRTVNAGALQFTLDEATTIAELRRRFPGEFDDIVKTSQKILKDQLKRQYPKILSQLHTAYAESSSTLTIRSLVSHDFFRRPVQHIHERAAALGLINRSTPELGSKPRP